MSEKITGYTLLVCGIALILFCAFNVYFVFTKQAQPVQLFSFPAISFDMSQSLTAGLPPEIARSLPKTAAKPTELISANMLNQTSNIFAHLFLMGFLASIGEKLASLGIQLVRPIVVKSKEERL